MNPREQGFLLLTSCLGNPERRPLTPSQFRTLASRVQNRVRDERAEDLNVRTLAGLGYDEEMSQRILSLLEEDDLLAHYLHRGQRMDCCPVTRISPAYPLGMRKRLGLDSPGCLWAKGDTALLDTEKISLVGSRALNPENLEFAAEAGKQAALQGYTLVSGNARGADRVAQQSCLEHGGRVISIVADALEKCPLQRSTLYLSEDGFDLKFSAQRALSRNRIIHTLGRVTLVAQCTLNKGGTWDGTVRNLKNNWAPVFCFRDGSAAAAELVQMGAEQIGFEELKNLSLLDTHITQIQLEEIL